MDFRRLDKFVKGLKDEYDIPGFDISVYYNHINVYRKKNGFTNTLFNKKVSSKDLYIIHSGAKILCCVAIMQLVERYKLTLKDKVVDYVPDFPSKDTLVCDMIKNYSHSISDDDTIYNHKSVVTLISNASGETFDSFINKNIINPLKMKSTSFNFEERFNNKIAKQYIYDKKNKTMTEHIKSELFFKKNIGSLITNVSDYSAFCETICNNGIAKNGYVLLSPFSIDILINNLIYNETEKEDAFVSVGCHGSLVLIDIKKKITIVYVQHTKDIDRTKLDMYPKLRKIVYECIGADTWSTGYNILP